MSTVFDLEVDCEDEVILLDDSDEEDNDAVTKVIYIKQEKMEGDRKQKNESDVIVVSSVSKEAIDNAVSTSQSSSNALPKCISSNVSSTTVPCDSSVLDEGFQVVRFDDAGEAVVVDSGHCESSQNTTSYDRTKSGQSVGRAVTSNSSPCLVDSTMPDSLSEGGESCTVENASSRDGKETNASATVEEKTPDVDDCCEVISHMIGGKDDDVICIDDDDDDLCEVVKTVDDSSQVVIDTMKLECNDESFELIKQEDDDITIKTEYAEKKSKTDIVLLNLVQDDCMVSEDIGSALPDTLMSSSSEVDKTNNVQVIDRLPHNSEPLSNIINAQPKLENNNVLKSEPYAEFTKLIPKIKKPDVQIIPTALDESIVIRDALGNTVCKLQSAESVPSTPLKSQEVVVSDSDVSTVGMDMSQSFSVNHERLIDTIDRLSTAFAHYPPSDSLSSYDDMNKFQEPNDSNRPKEASCSIDGKLKLKAFVKLDKIDVACMDKKAVETSKDGKSTSGKQKVNQREQSHGCIKKCPFCPSFPRNVSNHMRCHKEKRHLQCPYCSFSCSSRSSYVLHKRLHLKITNSSSKAKLSPAKKTQKELVKTKMTKNAKKKTNTVSNASVKSKSPVATTVKKKALKMKCRFCPFSSLSKDVLENHQRQHNLKRKLNCSVCNFSCNLVSALKEHRKLHIADSSKEVKGKFKCKFCPAILGNGWNEKVHRQCHRRVTRHMCPYCSYAACSNQVLEKHLLCHKNESGAGNKLVKFSKLHLTRSGKPVSGSTRKKALISNKSPMSMLTKCKVSIARSIVGNQSGVAKDIGNMKQSAEFSTTTNPNSEQGTSKKLEIAKMRLNIKLQLLEQAKKLVVRNSRRTPVIYECKMCNFKNKYRSYTDKHILETHLRLKYSCPSYGCFYSTHALKVLNAHKQLCQPTVTSPVTKGTEHGTKPAVSKTSPKSVNSHSSKRRAGKGESVKELRRNSSNTPVGACLSFQNKKARSVGNTTEKKMHTPPKQRKKSHLPSKKTSSPSNAIAKSKRNSKSTVTGKSTLVRKKGRSSKGKTKSSAKDVPRFIEELMYMYTEEESSLDSGRSVESNQPSPAKKRRTKQTMDISKSDQTDQYVDMGSTSDVTEDDDDAPGGLRIINVGSQHVESPIEIDSAIDYPGQSGLFNAYQMVEIDPSQSSSTPGKAVPNYGYSQFHLNDPRLELQQRMELQQRLELQQLQGIGLVQPSFQQYPGSFSSPHLSYLPPHVTGQPITNIPLNAMGQNIPPNAMGQPIQRQIEFGQPAYPLGPYANSPVVSNEWKCRFCNMPFQSPVDVVRHENSHLE